ncbi:unnamed protein product [Gongylonema pulchrum]|uniref:Uncharacterized protein n=1 Tax=Gongylonema pulchrum TaxID=637853 RepID=A0A183D2M2_9BILA|nr:unnamed protein product [Gongylonema pulchrum]
MDCCTDQKPIILASGETLIPTASMTTQTITTSISGTTITSILSNDDAATAADDDEEEDDDGDDNATVAAEGEIDHLQRLPVANYRTIHAKGSIESE